MPLHLFDFFQYRTMSTISGKPVGEVGFGMMNLTWRETPIPDEQAFATLRAALAAGANMWNGADFYGPPDASSLQLLNRYFSRYPKDADKVVLSIKGGVNQTTHKIDGKEANVRRCIENALKILDGRKKIDIWAMARQDPEAPLEETLGAAAEYVRSGQIGGIGISEVTAEQIKANAKVHPIAAVEVELSLHTPDILNNGVAATCGSLNIPIVAYSPLGRGLLTGLISKKTDLDTTDIRHALPRFSEDNINKNAKVAEELQKFAKAKGATPAQIAIAWAKLWTGRDGLGPIIPIPGSTTPERATENCKTLTLAEAEFNELEDLRRQSQVVGARYPGEWA